MKTAFMKMGTLMIAGLLAGSMTMTAAPVEAQPKGSSSAKKTTKSTASKTRPGYSNKKTKRRPARTAASVLKSRDRRAAPRNIVAYKSGRKARSGDAAKASTSGGNKAAGRKRATSVTSDVLPRLTRSPSGRITTRTVTFAE